MIGSADAVRLSGRRNGRHRQREMPDGSPESETPRMQGNSLHGNQEIPVAPDTGEGSEQKVKTSGGAGGKAVDQGERNEGIHGPGAGPGDRVHRTSRRAGSRTEREGTKVHHAAASRERATAAGQLLSAKETSCARSG